MITILLVILMVLPISVLSNFTEFNETKIAYLSKQLILDCPMRFQDENRSLVIYHIDKISVQSNGKTYDSSSTERMIPGPNYTLIVKNIEYRDAFKSWKCEVYSSKKLYTVNIKLIVRGPPNNLMYFNATSSDSNEITVYWDINITNFNLVEYYNITICKKELTQNCSVRKLQHPIYKYTFQNLEPFQEYLLSIFAYNHVGNNDRMDLTVLTKPGIPTARPYIIHNKANNRNISLTIECFDCSNANKMKGILKGFNVNYLAKYQIYENITKLVNNSDTKPVIVIGNLHPYQNYTFYVRAWNGYKYGPAATLQVNTTQDYPNPTMYLSTRHATSTTIEVTWSPASNDHGPITGYILKYAENQSNKPEVHPRVNITLDATTFHYTINNLKARTHYKIYLASVNSFGVSKYASALTRTDRPEPSPPRNVSVKLLGKLVQVFWRPSQLNNQSMITGVYQHLPKYSVCWNKSGLYPHENCEPANTNYEHVFCNQTTNFCQMNISLHKFKTNSTYTFFIRVSVPSETCEIDINCRMLEASSNKITKLIIDTTEADERINKIWLVVFIMVMIFIFFLLVSVTVICKSNFKKLCLNHSHHRSIYYSRAHANSDHYLEHAMYQANNNNHLLSNNASVPPPPLINVKILPLDQTPYPPIPVDTLIEHILTYKADDGAGFQAEFEAIESSSSSSPHDCSPITAPGPLNTVPGLGSSTIRWSTSIAKYKDNINKNRYTNIFPYDHSRVQLQNPPYGKSDYINASFIDGYKRDNAYIATQGPLKETIGDFWQMIWEQNCQIIVMISNFIERGRCKCEEYWDRKETTFGNIAVRLVYDKQMAFYTERRFRIKNIKNKKSGNKDRLVYHYQYTDWRDFDVPPSPLPVLVFVRASTRHWTSSGPIVVHCSAGVGRTGTYICIESQIRQMESEHQVNIRGFLEHIRQQRMRLVQTESQYTFVHDALYEYFICPDHEVYKDDLSTYIHRMKEIDPVSGHIKLDLQFKKCIQYEPSEFELNESHNKLNENKNRSNIVPINSRRINLACEPGVEGSNYINASVVQGYWDMREYIITQHPLSHTEPDFWKMVWDENCSFIVLLSDCTANTAAAQNHHIESNLNHSGDQHHSQTAPLPINSTTTTTTGDGGTGILPLAQLHRFWPEHDCDARDFRGGMRVSFRNYEELACSGGIIGMYEFLLSSSAEDYAQSVRMLHLCHWPSSLVSNESGALLRLLTSVTQWRLMRNDIPGGMGNSLDVMMDLSASSKQPPTSHHHYTHHHRSNNSSISCLSVHETSAGNPNADVVSSACPGLLDNQPIITPPPIFSSITGNPLLSNGGVLSGSYCPSGSGSSGPIVLIDELGGSRAGIFAAMTTLLWQLHQDECVDVYFVVKMLSIERPHLFQDASDLEFVYELLNYVVEKFPGFSSTHHSLANQSRQRDSNISNGGIFSHLNHNSIFHYATLGNHNTGNHNHHQNNNSKYRVSRGSHQPNHNNSQNQQHHYSNSRDSSNTNDNKRRRASSVESSSLTRQHNQTEHAPDSQLTSIPTVNSNYHANRTSWHTGETRPDHLPLLSINNNSTINAVSSGNAQKSSPPISAPPQAVSSSCYMQIIANPLVEFTPSTHDQYNHNQNHLSQYNNNNNNVIDVGCLNHNDHLDDNDDQDDDTIESII